MNHLPESEVLPLIVSQLIAYGYSAVATQVADATGAETDMMPSSKLAEYVTYGKEQVDNEGSDSDFSDKESDVEPMKEDKQESEDFSETHGLVFEPDNFPAPKPAPEYTQMYYTQHKGPCLTAVFSPDGKLAATGSHDASLKVLDVHKMKHRTGDAGDKPVIRTLYDHVAPVSDISFHPNGSVLASCSEDQSIKLFDLSRHGVKRAFRYLKDSQAVNSISFHPSGDFILSGTTDANVRIYDVKTFQCYTNKTNNTHRGGITQIRYSTTGRLFASSSMDGSLRIWDGVNSQCVRAIERAHGGAVASSVRITKNEKYVLSAGADSTLKMWEIASGKMVMEYKGHQQHHLLLQPTMTYNEDYVMVGDEGSTDVLCWDTRTGVLLKRLPGQNNNVRCVVASPIDDAYLTCSDDYRARYYVRV
ncbi:WD40-repeat-containing domain protein [Umbelopsis sp. PMI_123]|nr:WD40-repeat-containing domain protein [Umbelopsis sp. PMI_123]